MDVEAFARAALRDPAEAEADAWWPCGGPLRATDEWPRAPHARLTDARGRTVDRVNLREAKNNSHAKVSLRTRRAMRKSAPDLSVSCFEETQSAPQLCRGSSLRGSAISLDERERGDTICVSFEDSYLGLLSTVSSGVGTIHGTF